MAEPHELTTVQLLVRTQANGATATLRVIAQVADREEARRLDAELTRICTELQRRHGFGAGRVNRKEEKRR